MAEWLSGRGFICQEAWCDTTGGTMTEHDVAVCLFFFVFRRGKNKPRVFRIGMDAAFIEPPLQTPGVRVHQHLFSATLVVASNR